MKPRPGNDPFMVGWPNDRQPEPSHPLLIPLIFINMALWAIFGAIVFK